MAGTKSGFIRLTVMRKTSFHLTPDHITLLRNSFVTWDSYEPGAASIDAKRPYGNKTVAKDIARLLNIPWDADNPPGDDIQDKLVKLHRETEIALQIVLTTGSFVPGLYECPEFYFTHWSLVKADI